MNLATLHQNAIAEDLAERGAKAFSAVNDEEDAVLTGESSFWQFLQKLPTLGGFLRRALAQSENLLFP